MRAAVIREGSLVVEDRPEPEPGVGEVRVRVHASAVNRADLIQIRGMYPAPNDAVQDVPGLEYAGVVDAVGPKVFGVAVGDRVYGLVGGGAYAESLVVHAETCAPLPEGVNLVEAAALPEAYLTAYDAMVSQAGLSAGETVLVHAVGSGVGTAALQIARAIGASVVGTARTETKLDDARAMGLEHGIAVSDARFAEAVLAATGGRGVDVVLDLVGGAYVNESLGCMAAKGRLVLVGLLAGAHGELDLGAILRKRLSIRGTVMRSRPLEEKLGAARVLARHLGPLFASRRLTPVIHREFSLAEANEAVALVARNEGFGKVVLRCHSGG